MQERPLQRRQRLQVRRDAARDAAIGGVAADRVADRAEMHADLVRAAGVDGDADQRHARQVQRPRHARHGRSRPPRTCRHLLPRVRIAADRRLDAPAVLDQPPHQRDVLLLDFAIVELPGQFRVRHVALGDHHHARRALVEPVDDARRIVPPTPLRSCTWCSSAFTSVPVACPAAGCTTMPGRLVDDDDLLVLEQDVERDVLGQRLRRPPAPAASTLSTVPGGSTSLALVSTRARGSPPRRRRRRRAPGPP